MGIFQGFLKIRQLSTGGVWDFITKCCLYLALLLTPLIFLPWSLYPLSLSKQFILTTLVLLALISWLIKGVVRGELLVAKTPINIIVGLLVVFTIFSAFFSGSRTISFMGVDGGEVDTFINLLSFALLYFLIASTLREEKEVNWAFYTFLISSVGVLVFGLLQMWQWHIFPWPFALSNAFNSIGTTNALSIFLGLVFVAIMTILYQGNKVVSSGMKGLLGFLAAVVFATVFLIGYWPVFLGIMVAMIILVVTNLRTRAGEEASRGNLLIFAILAVSVFVILVQAGYIRVKIPVFGLPAEITPSVKASWAIAKNTIQEGAKNFILGSGPATFQYQYGLYRDTSLNATIFWNLKFSQAYNAFLTHLANWGFMGTLLFALFLLVVLITVFRVMARGDKHYPSLFWGVEIGLVYLILMLFFYPQNYVLYFSLFALVGMMTAYVSSARDNYFSISLVKSPQKTFVFSLVMMILIMAATAVLYINVQRYLGSVYFAQGVNLANTTGDIEQAMPYLASGVDLDPKNDVYLQALANAFLLRVSNILNKPSVSPQELQAEFSRNVGSAIETARQATRANLRNSANWLVLARVYESVILLIPGAAEQALAAYSEAAKLEPNSPLIYSNLGRTNLAAADRLSQELTAVSAGDSVKIKELREKRNAEYSQAIENFDKALNLKSDYAPAHFSLVQVFDRQGKTEEAIARAERLKVVVLSDNDPGNDIGVLFQLGLLHYQAKRYNKAREAFEGAVSLSPDYSNALYFLGLIYDKQGDSSLALEQFEHIARLNPDNQEVKKIIFNLKTGRAALFGVTENIEERRQAPIEEGRLEVIPSPTPPPAPTQ